MNRIKTIRKGLVALVGIAVAVGILEPGIAQDVVAVLTAVAVYLVPNQS